MYMVCCYFSNHELNPGDILYIFIHIKKQMHQRELFQLT